ncbi:MAG TPA: BLUF domain-containing protein [Bryobacteraceae bacterium]|nr:BLUF domain-containing protein [Bryobacteraceae bacterium]
MLSLTYVSSATREFTESELVNLLSRSRENNERHGLTGMLLYKDGSFIQVLEGPDEAVRQLFDIISADDRHRGVIRLLERQIEQREFPEWRMAFQNLNDPALRDLPGYSEFMNEHLDSDAFRKNSGRAHRLLEVFRRNMNR